MSEKIMIVYPVPADRLELFTPDMERFARTLRQYPPDADNVGLGLVLSHINGRNFDATVDLVGRIFGGFGSVTARSYTGQGCDIGSHQHAAFSFDSDFMVFCSTRVHFHRAGWLARLLEAREKFGARPYFAMACHERRTHGRTCFYAMEPRIFREYPHLIRTRDDTFKFETGDWCFAQWCEGEGYHAKMVTWDGIYNLADCRAPALRNIYRRGDQTNCLAWDRHTQLYAEADEKRKEVLRSYAGG